MKRHTLAGRIGLGSLLLCLSASAQELEVQKLTAALPAAGGLVGMSVAIEGDLAVVGQPGADSVLVYNRVAGSWVLDAEIMSPLGSGSQFGRTASLSGGIVVVGDYLEDSASLNAGGVHLFQNQAGTWVQTEHLVAVDFEIHAYFGIAHAIQGSQLAIGSSRKDDGAQDTGAVYLYSYVAPFGWIFDGKLAATGLAANHYFGTSVAIDETGSYMAVGATGANEVHMFEKVQGAWTEVSVHSGGSSFGASLALGTDLLLAGEYAFDLAGLLDCGAVHVIENQGGVWSESAILTSPFPVQSGVFGYSVAAVGSRFFVGANHNDSLMPDTGSAYEYMMHNGQWTLRRTYWPSDGAADDYFGQSIAATATGVLVGSYLHDAGANNAGAAYYYDLGPETGGFTFPLCYCDDFITPPCNNRDSAAGCANFFGTGAIIEANGSTSVSTDDLQLTVSEVLPNNWGIIFMSQALQPSGAVPFGDGALCITQNASSPIVRFSPKATGAGATYSEGPGLLAAHSGFISAGDTWYFQGWYRDPIGPCGNAYNLTNAVGVVFVP